MIADQTEAMRAAVASAVQELDVCLDYSEVNGSRYLNQSQATAVLTALWKQAALASQQVPEWQPMEKVQHHFAVLVSKPFDGYQNYKPTTAFIDATGVWRVFNSEGGNCPLYFQPTHWMDIPAAPAADREGK